MIDQNSALTIDFFEKGSSLSCPVIDMHAHMFNFGGSYMIAKTPEAVIRAMDRSGVRLTLFCSHTSLFGGYHGNALDLAAAKQYPGRFMLYYPVTSPVCDAARDLRAMDENPEYAGMKFLPEYYSVKLSDDRHTPYFEYADAKKLPILCHTWGNSPYDGVDEAEKVLCKYHNLRFIAGHSFRGDWERGIALAKEHDNLYLELTAVLSQRGKVDDFVRAGLSKRIVFGVDAPWFSYDFGIGALLSAEISDADRYNILYENARKILTGADITPPDYIKKEKSL